MNKIDRLFLNEFYYHLQGRSILVTKSHKIADEIGLMISVNKRLEVITYDYIRHIIFDCATKHKLNVNTKLSSYLNANKVVAIFFDDYTAWNAVKEQLLQCYNKVDFMYVDLTDLSAITECYNEWMLLRKCCLHLLLKMYSYGDIRYLLYDFANPVEISLIFPIYNVSQYLEECFSVFRKCKEDFVELLAINDGSTDDSLAVLERLHTIDPRIKIVNQKNGGCAAARSRGLELARGKYVGFIDPDDFVSPDFIAKMHQAAIFTQCQVVQCGFKKYYSDYNLFVNEVESQQLQEYETPVYQYIDPLCDIVRISNIAIWRRLYLREFLLENKIDFYKQLKRFDDLPFFFEVFAYCTSFVVIPDKLYTYRLNRPGQDVSANDDKLFVHFEIFCLLEDFYHKRTAANIEVLKNLLITRASSHLWALLQIDKKYLHEYIVRLRADCLMHIKTPIFSYLVLRKGCSKLRCLGFMILGGTLYFKQYYLIKIIINILRSRKHLQRSPHNTNIIKLAMLRKQKYARYSIQDTYADT